MGATVVVVTLAVTLTAVIALSPFHFALYQFPH
jgi:hypothetical protein